MLDIRGSGTSWTLVQDGRPVGAVYSTFALAVAAEAGVLRRMRPPVGRKCLTCGDGFPSHGIGNRLCDDCRAAA